MRTLVILLCVIASFNSICVHAFQKLRGLKLLNQRSKRRTTQNIFPSENVDERLINDKLGISLNPRRFLKSTKQIATLGPSSNTPELIEKLFLSGADVFRLNFSHGEYAEKSLLVDHIREIERKYNYPIAILADLQGPKLRIGKFKKGKVHLKEKQVFTFDNNDEDGNEERVQLPHPQILNTLKVGDILLIDDGKLRFKVIETFREAATPENMRVSCEVMIGGAISNKKGVNTPTIILPISPLTDKDRRDLEFIKQLDIDWVALSFVQKPEDMIELRNLAGNKLKLMAKLEKPSAIDYLDEIVDLSDGVMVARGDLGVEISPWDVPVVQKRIVETCKLLGKPVVIATQMMESMIENPTPTRAEASDCATAIYDATDAVMLSAESAAGQWPVEAVTMQQQVINKVEVDDAYLTNLDRFALEMDVIYTKDSTTAAITMAIRQVADISKSKAIIAFTSKGATAVHVAKLRPKVPIIAICYDIYVARQLALVWGVHPMILEKSDNGFNISAEVEKVCNLLQRIKFADPSKDFYTITAALPFGTSTTTNVIRVCSAAGPNEPRNPQR